MRDKLSYLREQLEAYWRDAKAQADEAEAERLIVLAIRCQEMILELEHGIRLSASESAD
ncbi:MAG TPA: hypothetical protein VN823_17690 [Stellaceae bacterium]|nr:hypothetical protein [Stellaceae bacterium]